MKFRLVTFLALAITCGSSVAEETCIRLKAQSNLGIPVHPVPGKPAVVHRFADGTTAEKLEVDADTGWIRVKANAVEGWIVKRYIDAEVPCAPAPVVAEAGRPGEEQLYVIGCWNLEHFHEGATRGFPETPGKFPSRTQEDYEAIAAIIEELGLKIVALSEINAEETEVIEEEEAFTDMRSPELERLIQILGKDNYDYTVAESGGTQHIAILFDKRCARLNAAWEMDLPEIKIQKKSICDRQPLVGHFTLLDGDRDMNDLAVVGVHLASGQQNNKNHDKAMQLIQEGLASARAENWCIPRDENDIVIVGDFNTNRFDNVPEQFWEQMEAGGWDVLADDEEEYSPTRLSGKPLGLRNSRIDYIICTSGNGGLQNEEVSDKTAIVHAELIAGGADEFRGKASDHLPVTIRVRLIADTDSP